MDFSMKVFVFLVWSLLKIDFSMKAYVFLVSRIVEDGAVLFIIWICKVLKTRIVFSVRVFVFLVSGLLKMDFQWECFFLVLGIVEDGAVSFFHLNL